MTTFLHQRTGRDDADALSYLKDTGWTSRMTTPSPATHLVGAAVILGAGIWACVAIAGRSAVAAVLVGLVAAALFVVDALPALWTMSHRQYTDRYLAARARYGNGRARIHPWLVLVGLPGLCFVAAGFTGGHESGLARTCWGLLGAAIGLLLGLLRVAHARSVVSRH